MAEDSRLAADKDAVRGLIEARLRWRASTKGELARALSISAGALSRKLGSRYPQDRFSQAEIDQIAAYLDLDAEQQALLHGSRRFAAPAAAPASGGGAHGNLPLPLSSFVGREREQAEVLRLLATTRLLTLTGAGGSGKTRLALEVGWRAVTRDGVWMVELAPLSDPRLLAEAVASALHVSDQRGRPATESLIAHLRPRPLLLLLDNCEHLRFACAKLAARLLRACPELQILATSREALGVAGEVTWLVPPLSLPDPQQRSLWGSLAASEAAQLFVERARLSRAGFGLTEENAEAVAQICRRLDGMPLALELAAARTQILTVQQIAARLDDRFGLLAGRGRPTPPHQQTLRTAMDWS
ncbi:MAG TPA: AAA family ATPase, partial [Steroidobacteraceae bacterium]|nr:AAA family ATPase [Steroidobacteraceae bacterium]